MQVKSKTCILRADTGNDKQTINHCDEVYTFILFFILNNLFTEGRKQKWHWTTVLYKRRTQNT